jgi:hypothetical protein
VLLPGREATDMRTISRRKTGRKKKRSLSGGQRQVRQTRGEIHLLDSKRPKRVDLERMLSQ